MQSEQIKPNLESPEPFLASTETIEGATENAASDSSLMGFFAVGVVVNIVLIAVYIIWAMGQWKKKPPKSDGR